MTLRELITRIGFTVDERGLDVYDKAIGRIYEKTEKMYTNLAKVADHITAIGQKASLFLSAPIAGIATVSVMAETKLEDLRNKWGVLMNDMDGGAAFVDKIFREKMQFPNEQVEAYAAELQRLRVPIDQIIPKLRQYADINARTGASMEDLIGLQQSVNMGFVNPRLLRQLVGRGLLNRGDLAKIFGTSSLQSLMKMANAPGGISPAAITKLMDALAMRSAGSAEMRTRTLKKGFDELGDSVFRLRANVGEMLAKNVGLFKIMERLTNWVDKLTEKIDTLSPGMQKFILVLAGIAFAAGPVLIALGSMLKIFIGLQIAMFAMKATGFAAVIAGWGAAFVGFLAAAWPAILALTAGYLIIQDLYMYMKHGEKASLLGPLIGKGGAMIYNFVQNWIKPALDDFVNFFKNIWNDIRKWWDGLWSDPWKTLRDAMIPDWVEPLINMAKSGFMAGGATPKQQFAPSGMFMPALQGSTGVSIGNINVNATMPAGSTEQQLQAFRDAINPVVKNIFMTEAVKSVNRQRK
jgi:hypothetical protein